jgi:hypothetical protein
VTLTRVAQDRVRVQAAADKRSYRRADPRAALERDATGHVAALRDEFEADPGRFEPAPRGGPGAGEPGAQRAGPGRPREAARDRGPETAPDVQRQPEGTPEA